MSSQARSAFLEGISSLEKTLEESWAIEDTPRGAFVRRGLTVASFNLLETFILERLEEVAVYLNSGNLLYAELPQRLQLPAARTAIDVVSSRLRRVDDTERTRLAIELSNALSSMHKSTVSFSPLSWVWSGSNMGSDDYKSMLRKFHVEDAFAKVRDVAGRLGFQTSDPTTGALLDFADQLKNLAQERHSSAHDSAHTVSTMWLKTVGKTLLQFGSGFDILASVGAVNLRAATRGYFDDEGWTSIDRVALHLVKERTKDFALFTGASSKATKVLADGDELFRGASRNRKLNDVVVRMDRNGRLEDWTVPHIG